MVRSKEKKKPCGGSPRKPSGSLQPSCFCWRPQSSSKGVQLHTEDFYLRSRKSLISSVDAALGQNTLLAAESLSYGRGNHWTGSLCFQSNHRAFNLPDYTYPVFGIALGTPNQNHAVKPRLPYEAMVFEEEYHEQDHSTKSAYDRVQTEYAGRQLRKPGVSA